MKAEILPTRPVGYLDERFLDEEGHLRIVPAADYDAVDRVDLRLWCHHHAFYGLPTSELVAWLSERLAGRRAIEIGSGNGALGRALGIPRTDSYLQEAGTNPVVDFMHGATGQPRVRYGDDVERLEAKDAVRKYRPLVVVGMWISEKCDPSKPVPKHGGNMFGVNDAWILERVEEYILVSNLAVHGHRAIARPPGPKIPAQIIREPWIRSRASQPEEDVIFAWRNEK